jgi:hypothetical protein
MATRLHDEIIAPPCAVLANLNVPFSSPNSAVAKKKLVRRADRDYSQALRPGYQFAFLLLNVWLGGQFYLWVRHYETFGQSAYVARPQAWRGGYPSPA